MPSHRRPKASSFVGPAVVPFIAAAVVPSVVFTLIPFRDRVTYDFPWAQLFAIFLVPFIGVGLCTAAAFLTRPSAVPLKLAFLAFASGAVGVMALWFTDELLVVVRLDVITFLWSALLAVWVVGLVRSLIALRTRASSDDQKWDPVQV